MVLFLRFLTTLVQRHCLDMHMLGYPQILQEVDGPRLQSDKERQPTDRVLYQLAMVRVVKLEVWLLVTMLTLLGIMLRLWV